MLVDGRPDSHRYVSCLLFFVSYILFNIRFVYYHVAYDMIALFLYYIYILALLKEPSQTMSVKYHLFGTHTTLLALQIIVRIQAIDFF